MSNGGNVLISSAGRRVGLVECFQESLGRRESRGIVGSIDSGLSAPAIFLAERSWAVPRCTDPDFLNAVRQVCSENQVAVVVPTIDTELAVYAEQQKGFSAMGVTVCVSSPSTVRICCDKIATHEWLTKNGFPTVRQTSLEGALLDSSSWVLPLIAKPAKGSASKGVRLIQTRLDLDCLARTGANYIVQEIAPGREFTVNVYVSRSGECIGAVPHWRMEVRAGEVSKGITVKDRRLMDLARSVAETLPGAYGPLNIQCFVEDSGGIRIIEMNARFGGGYPLAHRAGARFTEWLLDELDGKDLSYRDDWTDDLAMLRYDEAVFVSGSKIRI